MQRLGQPAAILRRAPLDKRLLVQLDGPRILAQLGEDEAEVVQNRAKLTRFGLIEALQGFQGLPVEPECLRVVS